MGWLRMRGVSAVRYAVMSGSSGMLEVYTLSIGCGGVHVGIGLKALEGGIVCYVCELGLVVSGVSDAILVMARVPDFSGRLFSGCEGVSALDELYAARGVLVDGGRDQDVDMVGHDGESMKLELAGVAVSEKRCDEELGVRGELKMAMTLVCRDPDRVGADALAEGGHN